MKRFCIALLFSAAQSLAAQQVSGRVTDAQTGEPLIGANVLAENYNTGTATDSSGRYQLKLPEPGSVDISVSFIGYQGSAQSLMVLKNQKLKLNFKLKARETELDEITVQAVQAQSDAPIAQTNLKKKDLEREFSGQDAQFLLTETAPSIITYSEAGTNFSNYGGMRMRGIDQSRLNITLNGAPLNDMLDQGVFFSNFTDIANSLSAVQVQRGVGFSTNGSASFGGSVNFQSENIWQKKPSTGVQLNAGSFNTFRGSAEYKSGLVDDKFAFYGRMTNFTTDGYRYHSGTDSWSMFFSGGYRGEKDLIKITAFNGRSRSNLSYTPVPEPLINQDPRTNVNFEQDRDNFGQQFVQLQYTRNINPKLNFNGSLYYGGAGGDFPFGLGDSLGNFSGQINYPLQNRHYGFYANALYSDDRFAIKGGLHGYIFNRENWETMLPNSAQRIYSDSTQKNEISGFVNAEYDFGLVKLFADVQVRQTNIDFYPDRRFVAPAAEIPTYDYTFINPKVGINFRVNKKLMAYASFGRTGREPTKFDLFGGSTRLDSTNLQPYQRQNNVEPEYVNDFEGGLRYQNKALSGRLNFFWMDFEDKIEPIGERLDQFGFVQLRKNVPQSFRRGVELEGSYQTQSGLYFRGFLTYIDAEIEEYAPEDANQVYTDVRPALTPEFQGQLTAGYHWLDYLDVSLTGRYLSEQFIEPTNQENLKVPSSFVLDSRISWNFWKEHRITLRVNNILDQLYYTYGEVGSFQGQTVPAYFVQPPRNFSVMLDMRF